MAATKPPVIGTAVAAWADAFNMIGAMPFVVGIALAIMIVVSLLGLAFLPSALCRGTLAAGFHRCFQHHPGAAARPAGDRGAPLCAARRTDRPLSARSVEHALHALRQFCHSGQSFSARIPGAIESFTPNPYGIRVRPSHAAIALVALLVIVAVVVVRRAILFPAIAIDAPGATWSNARRDTKGSSWRVAFIFVCVALPAVVISIPLWYLTVRTGFGHGGRMMFAVVGSVVDIPTLCAFAAAASHIYRARADSLM